MVVHWLVAIVYQVQIHFSLHHYPGNTYSIRFDHHLFQDLQEKFGEFGNLAEIHKIPG